jgi:thiamine pyrophosphokinase
MSEHDDILKYASPVVLVGAAPVQIGKALEMLPEAWPLIAADGGADALLENGRRPDLVIGDMDSAGPLPDDLPQLPLDGQDDTDFEKCLSRIHAPLIVGLGFLEGRLDHTLAAIHALMTLPHDRPVMLVGDTDLVLRLRGDIAFEAEPGDRVSLWPLGSQAFHSSQGLKWPLDGLEMAAGRMIGTSNAAAGRTVRINAGAGDGYAVIMPRGAAQSLINAVLGSV